MNHIKLIGQTDLRLLLRSVTRTKEEVLDTFINEHNALIEAKEYARLLRPSKDSSTLLDDLKAFNDFMQVATEDNKKVFKFVITNRIIKNEEIVSFTKAYTYLIKQKLEPESLKSFEKLLSSSDKSTRTNTYPLLTNHNLSRNHLKSFTDICRYLSNRNSREILSDFLEEFNNGIFRHKFSQKIISFYLELIYECITYEKCSIRDITASANDIKDFSDKEIEQTKDLITHIFDYKSASPKNYSYPEYVEFSLNLAKERPTKEQIDRLKNVYQFLHNNQIFLNCFSKVVKSKPNDETFNFFIDLIKRINRLASNHRNLAYDRDFLDKLTEFIHSKPSNALLDTYEILSVDFLPPNYDYKDLTSNLTLISNLENKQNESDIDFLKEVVEKYLKKDDQSSTNKLLFSFRQLMAKPILINSIKNAVNTLKESGMDSVCIPLIHDASSLSRLNIDEESFNTIISFYTQELKEGKITNTDSFFREVMYRLEHG